MANKGPVLVSWVAVGADPYERDRGTGEFRRVDGELVPGPTLSLLLDEASRYQGRIHDCVILHSLSERPLRAYEELVRALLEKDPGLRIEERVWMGDNPTDHTAIYEFLSETLPEIRKKYRGRELVIHVSPGTASMHTVWVLMAETGLIEAPFVAVQSYSRKDRRGKDAVVPVEVGIESFYKAYQTLRPRQADDEQCVRWDRAKFRSEAMKSLFDEAQRFAGLNVPVLILGERGTGKTTLAEWIRVHSRFRKEGLDRAWPAVACGQYTAETMRSELFGYVKGAFTGADTNRDGLLAKANGDTLFLDEIGDVSPDLQRLLIKALEEKRYQPLGSQSLVASEFRLVTATNLSPEEIRARLDPDFLDRISLLTLRLPPLREITEELPWLWEQVYLQAAHRAGVSLRDTALGTGHHKRVVAQLASHRLPGNIRELFRVAFRILAARGDLRNRMTPRDAVEYGLRVLDEGWAGVEIRGSSSMAAARAFTDGTSLAPVIDAYGPVEPRQVIKDLQEYLSRELLRLAGVRGNAFEDICIGLTRRGLSNWLPQSIRNSSSEGRNASSES